MSTFIHWGILGYARIARTQLIPAIAASGNGRVFAIASRHSNTLAEAQQQVPDARGYTDYEALIHDPDIHAIYIPLPNAQHHPWAIAALNAGKHVLCEKPLALNAAQARDMQAAAQRNDRLLMEAFMYRYTACTRQVQAVLASGVLGDIRQFNASFRFLLDRANTIKVDPSLGGGAFYDVGVYPLNLLGLLTGNALPVACHAEGNFEHGVDVGASALLRFDTGLIATLHCGFNSFNQMTAEIVGSLGRLHIPSPFIGDAGHLNLITAAGERRIEFAATERYTEQVRDFSAAILEGRPPLLTLDESIRNMDVLDMIYAQLRSASDQS